MCLDDEINTKIRKLGEELGEAEKLDAESFSGKLLAAMRNAFGGHPITPE